MSFHTRHLSSPHAFDLNQEQFAERVLQASHHRPMLVDFWADWCGPCHQLTPHLYRVVDDLSGLVGLAKVEVDAGENMKLAGHFRLRGFPTVLLFQDGAERGRFSGARASPQIREWLLTHLAPGAAREYLTAHPWTTRRA